MTPEQAFFYLLLLFMMGIVVYGVWACFFSRADCRYCGDTIRGPGSCKCGRTHRM